MTDKQLAEIEARLNAPMMRLWSVFLSPMVIPKITPSYAIGNMVILLSQEEATLIACAPADIAALLAEVRRLQSIAPELIEAINFERAAWGDAKCERSIAQWERVQQATTATDAVLNRWEATRE